MMTAFVVFYAVSVVLLVAAYMGGLLKYTPAPQKAIQLYFKLDSYSDIFAGYDGDPCDMYGHAWGCGAALLDQLYEDVAPELEMMKGKKFVPGGHKTHRQSLRGD